MLSRAKNNFKKQEHCTVSSSTSVRRPIPTKLGSTA